jgi:hypothetical protein
MLLLPHTRWADSAQFAPVRAESGSRCHAHRTRTTPVTSAHRLRIMQSCYPTGCPDSKPARSCVVYNEVEQDRQMNRLMVVHATLHSLEFLDRKVRVGRLRVST